MAGKESTRWLVRPRRKVRLADIDPGATDGAPGGKHETTECFKALNQKLWGLQERLWAEQRRALLVVIQGMDAGGKDGVVKHVFKGVNPQGTRVAGFKAPTDEELAHDFL